jgi:hypothetical protein
MSPLGTPVAPLAGVLLASSGGFMTGTPGILMSSHDAMNRAVMQKTIKLYVILFIFILY